MTLKNPGLWEKLEREIEFFGIKFGEIDFVLMIQEGLPWECKVKNFVKRIRSAPEKQPTGNDLMV